MWNGEQNWIGGKDDQSLNIFVLLILLEKKTVNARKWLKKFKIYICVNTYMEKAMANHSNTLAWKIPWTKEPGRLQAMGREKSDMID